VEKAPRTRKEADNRCLRARDKPARRQSEWAWAWASALIRRNLRRPLRTKITGRKGIQTWQKWPRALVGGGRPFTVSLLKEEPFFGRQNVLLLVYKKEKFVRSLPPGLSRRGLLHHPPSTLFPCFPRLEVIEDQPTNPSLPPLAEARQLPGYRESLQPGTNPLFLLATLSFARPRSKKAINHTHPERRRRRRRLRVCLRVFPFFRLPQ